MASESPPNILLITTDQQRADTIAALGNPTIQTPTLDRLVQEGTAFTRCYTPSPVCVPARHAPRYGPAASPDRLLRQPRGRDAFS